MKKIITVLVALVLGIGIGAGVALSLNGSSSEGEESAQTLKTSLQEVCKLSLYEYTFKEIVTHDNDAYKYDITGLSENKFIGTMDVSISIGVDLDNDSISVDESRDEEGNLKSVDIKLPHSQILDINGYQETLAVVEDKNGWFNNMTAEDYNDAEIEAKDNAKKECESSDVFDKADERLVELLTNHIHSIENEDAKVNVSFIED